MLPAILRACVWPTRGGVGPRPCPRGDRARSGPREAGRASLTAQRAPEEGGPAASPGPARGALPPGSRRLQGAHVPSAPHAASGAMGRKTFQEPTRTFPRRPLTGLCDLFPMPSAQGQHRGPPGPGLSTRGSPAGRWGAARVGSCSPRPWSATPGTRSAARQRRGCAGGQARGVSQRADPLEAAWPPRLPPSRPVTARGVAAIPTVGAGQAAAERALGGPPSRAVGCRQTRAGEGDGASPWGRSGQGARRRGQRGLGSCCAAETTTGLRSQCEACLSYPTPTPVCRGSPQTAQRAGLAHRPEKVRGARTRCRRSGRQARGGACPPDSWLAQCGPRIVHSPQRMGVRACAPLAAPNACQAPPGSRRGTGTQTCRPTLGGWTLNPKGATLAAAGVPGDPQVPRVKPQQLSGTRPHLCTGAGGLGG